MKGSHAQSQADIEYLTVIVIWVDDLIIASTCCTATLMSVKKNLQNERFRKIGHMVSWFRVHF
jgi:hypothetical protein